MVTDQPQHQPMTVILCGVRGRPRGRRCVRYTQCPDCQDLIEVGSEVPHQCALNFGE